MSTNYSPGVLSVLPLFYVGWADSVLGPSEQNLILEKIDKMPHLSEDDKKLLKSWTDQNNPPNEEIFKSWNHSLKQNKKHWTGVQKDGLIKLGIDMAEAASVSGEYHKNPKIFTALKDLELVLGANENLNSDILDLSLKTSSINPKNMEETPFDKSHIYQFLCGPHIPLANKVKNLISDPFFLNTNEQRRNKDSYRNRILDQAKKLAEHQLSFFPFPEEFHGDNNPSATTVVFENLAYGDLSLLIKFGVQFGLFGGSIHMLGTKHHHEKYLKNMMDLELPGCFAMTETGHGSNVRGLETTATFDKSTQEFIIHSPNQAAGKEYIGNALHSTMAVVFAQLIIDDKSEGVHAFLVQLRDNNHQELEGITVNDNGYKMGLNGVDNGRIWFDQVRIPRENLLNKYGDVNENGEYSSPIKKSSKRFFTMLGALVQGRVCVALASNSAAKRSLAIATKYALKRRQFSQTNDTEETLIMDYPNHQKRLFSRLARTYAYHFGLEALRERFANKKTDADVRKVESLAAGLKAMASWHATDTIQECREACGGKGYLSENAFADMKADTDIFTTFEGDNHVLLQLVSKGLLTEFRSEFSDGGFMSIVRHLSARLSTSISELNPISIRNTSAEHLLDEEFHFAALEFHENKMLFSLANRMRNYIRKRVDPNITYAKVQNHMVSLAKASIENFCSKEFYKAVNKIENPELKVAMRRLARLNALEYIHENRGFFLENDYISGGKSKAIRKQIENLRTKIRPLSELYVDGFGIPDELIRAEIV